MELNKWIPILYGGGRQVSGTGKLISSKANSSKKNRKKLKIPTSCADWFNAVGRVTGPDVTMAR